MTEFGASVKLDGLGDLSERDRHLIGRAISIVLDNVLEAVVERGLSGPFECYAAVRNRDLQMQAEGIEETPAQLNVLIAVEDSPGDDEEVN